VATALSESQTRSDLEDVEVSQRGSDYEITGYPKKRRKDEG
jgi:hypothetical protein